MTIGREIFIAVMLFFVIDVFGLVLRQNDRVDPFVASQGPGSSAFEAGNITNLTALTHFIGQVGQFGPNFLRVGQFLHIVAGP